MLKKLFVEQFVIIDKLELEFKDGLTIFTGETGAGKSIILGAMSLILGAPSNPKSIRQGYDQSIFKATFSLPENHIVWQFLLKHNLVETAGGDFEIYRVMTQSGADIISVNKKNINREVLEELGGFLVEIHGQAANHTLLGPANQLNLLDLSGSYPPEFLTNVADALRDVRRNESDLKEEEEFLAIHKGLRLKKLQDVYRKFESIGMKDGFIPEAQAEYDRLMTAKETSQALQSILARFIASNGISGSLSAANRTLTSQEHIDADVVKNLAEYLSVALKNVRMAIDELGKISPQYEIDIAPINKYKHILETLRQISAENKIPYNDLNEYFLETETKYNRVVNGSTKVTELKDALIQAKNAYRHHAHLLSEKRTAAAAVLSKSITAELEPLKLNKAEFEIVVEEKADMPWTDKGFNLVTFTARMNPGMPFSPIAETASGGEMARMVLAIKVVLQRVQVTTTLVFDEVDVGIGGSAAAAVGDRIAQLAHNTQVMTITHSPQVASRGDQHLYISKHVDGEVTTSEVSTLSKEQRIEELSRMLAGDTLTEHSKAAAQSLIDEAVKAQASFG